MEDAILLIWMILALYTVISLGVWGIVQWWMGKGVPIGVIGWLCVFLWPLLPVLVMAAMGGGGSPIYHGGKGIPGSG